MVNSKPIVSLEDLVILPMLAGENASLCKVEGTNIFQFSQLDFKFTSKHVLGSSRWIVAILEGNTSFYDGNQNIANKSPKKFSQFIYRAKVEENGEVVRLPDIVLPSHFLNQTLAIKDDIIFLGGYSVFKKSRKVYAKENSGEIAGILNLSQDNPEWVPILLPVDMQEGKSIDDILVYEDKMVLVDNIMYPKYLFEYDINNPLLPIHAKTIELPNNGTYEHIHRGCINKNWITLYSTGIGDMGQGSYLSILSQLNYEQVLTVAHLERIYERPRLRIEDYTENRETELAAKNEIFIKDFTLVGDILFIANGSSNLSVVSLKGLLAAYKESLTHFKSRNKNTPDEEINTYFSVGKQLSLEKLIKDEGSRLNLSQFTAINKLIPFNNERFIAVGKSAFDGKTAYQLI